VAPLTRRSFLLGSAALAFTAACKGGGSSSAKEQVNLLVTSGQFLSGVDQRVGLVMKGQTDFIVPTGATLAFRPDKGTYGKPSPADVHHDALPAPAYISAVHRFDAPGTYWVRATWRGKSAEAPLTVADPSSSDIPIPGKPMVSTPTPTPTDARGVNPICTRNPVCPWHEPSLDASLAQHKPMAVLFATPALCQTATCGPVLDVLLRQKDAFAGKVNFLHVEIYTDGTAKTLAPAVQAYHLESEPILFLAGADGVVRERIDGLFGDAEASAALQRIAS
jgi:hypothetical protein